MNLIYYNQQMKEGTYYVQIKKKFVLKRHLLSYMPFHRLFGNWFQRLLPQTLFLRQDSIITCIKSSSNRSVFPAKRYFSRIFLILVVSFSIKSIILFYIRQFSFAFFVSSLKTLYKGAAFFNIYFSESFFTLTHNT